MKTLLVLHDQNIAWIREFFPDIHPLMLPICNKPLVEYLVDFSILSGCRELRIALDGSSSDLETYLGNGDKWGIEISYCPIRPHDDLDLIRAKNTLFCSDTPLLVFQGFFFLQYDRHLDYSSLETQRGNGTLCNAGDCTLAIHQSLQEKDTSSSPPSLLDITPLTTLEDIYRISMDILEHQSERYVLPGYSHENGVFIGRNVAIAKTATITKPVMLGNAIQIKPGAEIGPGAIIGNDVIIGANSLTRYAIVMDRTYIGEELDLSDKIACGHKLISPENNLSLTIEDAHLLSPISSPRKTSFARALTHKTLALLLLLGLALPYALCAFLLKLSGLWKVSPNEYLQDTTGKTITLQRVTITPKNVTARAAIALSLDRFNLLPLVLRGKLRLIGSSLIPAEDMELRTMEDISPYVPGVFRYAEAEGWPDMDFDPEMSDRFHMEHSTWAKDIPMTINALLTRLHSEKPS